MQFSENLADLLEADRRDLSSTGIYGAALAEYHTVSAAKVGSLYRATLWAKIAPPGNLYRYLSMYAESRKHSADIWEQIAAIAKEHRSLLAGESAAQEEFNIYDQPESEVEDCEAVLVDALKRAQVFGAPRTEQAKLSGAEPLPTLGFKPIEAFLESRPRRCGPLVVPTDPGQMRRYIQHRLMVLLVALIQVGVPVIIIIDEFHSNKTLTSHAHLHDVLFERMACLGTSLEEICHTLAGVLMLTVFVLIIHAYVDDQRHNARKTGVIPQNRFWYIIGNLINLWCGWTTVIAIPLVFWNEDSARGIVMDSLTLLFVFCLDDFSGWASYYIGLTDSDFQRGVAWHTAMLSQCPVRVADLINPKAKDVDDLWQIRFNDAGLLQVATGDQFSAWSAPASKRRLRPAKAMELSRLTQGSEEDLGSLSFEYSTREGDDDVLPRAEGKFLWFMWTSTGWVLSLVQIGVPIFWMVMNKQCDGTPGARADA